MRKRQLILIAVFYFKDNGYKYCILNKNKRSLKILQQKQETALIF